MKALDDVEVDPAPATRPTIDPERAETIRRTFLAEHPKATDATVALVEASTYRVETAGACFRAVLLDGGTRVLFALADPADLSIDLAPPTTRLLVGPPEPVVERDASVFDVHDARRDARDLLDVLRRLAERLRVATRDVRVSHAEEVERLAAVVPPDAVGSDYRPVSHALTITAMSRTAVETVALLAHLRSVLAEAGTFRRAAGPRLRDALVNLATARSGTESLAEVGSLSSLGEIARDRHSQAEVNLSDLEDRLDTLRRAVEEVAPLADRFDAAVRVHASAMLETSRRFHVAMASLTLSRLRTAAETVRVVSEAEVLATEAAYRLGIGGDTVPVIAWPADLLTPPEMKSGGK